MTQVTHHTVCGYTEFSPVLPPPPVSRIHRIIPVLTLTPLHPTNTLPRSKEAAVNNAAKLKS